MAQAPERRLVTEAAMMNTERRSALGIAAATRGNISAQTDANEMRNLTDIGVYAVRANNLINGPAGIIGNPVLNFEVFRNSSNGVTQRITANDRAWWRNAASDTTFNPWQEFGRAPVVATDSMAPLAEGQTLYLVDSGAGATDFAEFSAGYTSMWGAGVNTWILNNTNILGGRGVTYVGTSRAGLVWDAFSNIADADILVRAAIPQLSTSANGGVIARVVPGSAAGDETGYTAFVSIVSSVRSLVIAKFVNGAYTRLANVAFPIGDAEAYYLRFKLEGSTLRAKAWAVASNEPDGWMVSATDTQITASGLVALFQNSATRNVWDYLEIDTSGGA